MHLGRLFILCAWISLLFCQPSHAAKRKRICSQKILLQQSHQSLDKLIVHLKDQDLDPKQKKILIRSLKYVHKRAETLIQMPEGLNWFQAFELLKTKAYSLLENLLDINAPIQAETLRIHQVSIHLPRLIHETFEPRRFLSRILLKRDFAEEFWEAPQFYIGELLGSLVTQKALFQRIPFDQAKKLGDSSKYDFWFIERLHLASSHPIIKQSVNEALGVLGPTDQVPFLEEASLKQEKIYYRHQLEIPE